MNTMKILASGLAMYLMLILSVSAQNQQKKPNYEGMWLPLNLEELNYEDIKAEGLELPADQIYNEETASLEDAILRLDGGKCTGEIISGQGLVLTNHHCSYDYIANLSTPENDLLTDGFWATSQEEELPIEGAFVSFLKHSENITEIVKKELANVPANPFLEEDILDSIATAATEGTNLEAEVKEMFHGGEYYLFVYETYRDIRLVGAPPTSIGKFGKDKDNWMWPRHTGDFALLRIYADSNNEPAKYSEDNQPFKPKHFFPISLNGVDEGDYAMIMGYPGTTTRYLTSSAINLALNQTNLDRINLMGQHSRIMKTAMDQDDDVRIKLASDYSSLMNSYKYYIGQTTMLDRYDIVSERQKEEEDFQQWADSSPDRQEKYGSVLTDLKDLHEIYVGADKFYTYLLHNVLAPQASGFAYQTLMDLRGSLESGDQEQIDESVKKARKDMKKHFKHFVKEVDEQVFANMFMTYYNDLPDVLYPTAFMDILEPTPVAPPEPVVVEEEPKKKKKRRRKKKNKEPEPVVITDLPQEEPEKTVEEKIIEFTRNAYDTSIATDEARFSAFLDNPNLEALQADPMMYYVGGMMDFYYERVAYSKLSFEYQANAVRQTYIEGQKEQFPDKTFYPDANSTMRVTYGQVWSYQPKDGVIYEYQTTLDGVMEKEDPDDPDYLVDPKLVELYENQEFGQYGEGDKMPVCFLTTNDITGGNSGSPVLNSKGELIGCAFDGNWESMTGDIYIFPQFSRTICVDARYILFVVDKFAGASYLLEEMKIVKDEESEQGK
ncbi:MAG: S46 family peptidase [Bacteroidota bacterium]